MTAFPEDESRMKRPPCESLPPLTGPLPAKMDGMIPYSMSTEKPSVTEPTDISKLETLDDLRHGVKSVLADYENGRTRGEGVRRMDEIWDQVWRVEDTNENLKAIMNQGIVLFQNCYDQFLSEMKDDEAYLKRLEREAVDSFGTKEGEKKNTMFHVERTRIEKKLAKGHDNLRGYMDCIVKMSHEYRQCRTSQAFYIHVSQIQQFTGLVLAVLHQNIHQADVLKKISDAIGNASLKLFPQETTQDS